MDRMIEAIKNFFLNILSKKNKKIPLFQIKEKIMGEEDLNNIKFLDSEDIIALYKDKIKKNDIKEEAIVLSAFLYGFFTCAKKYTNMHNELVDKFNRSTSRKENDLYEITVLNTLSPIKTSTEAHVYNFLKKFKLTKKNLLVLNGLFEYNKENKKTDIIRGFFSNINDKNYLNTNFNYQEKKFYNSNVEFVFQGFISGYEAAEEHLKYLFALLRKNRLNGTVGSPRNFFQFYYHLTISLYNNFQKEIYDQIYGEERISYENNSLTQLTLTYYGGSWAGLKQLTLNKTNMYSGGGWISLLHDAFSEN